MKNIFLIIIFCAMLPGCKKELELKGTITGEVKLYQHYKPDIITEGINVTVENENFKTEGKTNSQGIFRIKNIENGCYDITFFYDGFGSRKMTNYKFLGVGEDAVIDRIQLYPMPDFNFNHVFLKLSSNMNGYTKVEGFMTSDPGRSEFVNVSLYFDQSPDVDFSHYKYSIVNVNSRWMNGDTIKIKDYVNNLGSEEDWYVATYISDSFDIFPPTTLKRAFDNLLVEVQ